MDIVLCLGFDLFFKPKLDHAATQAGIALRYAMPRDALAAARDATRIVADVSAPGVLEALQAIRAADPAISILACYPHVEEHRALAVRAIGGVAVTRGAFASRIPDALAGAL